MARIKIGVFGAGNMGKNHIRILKELNNAFELVGFYDKDLVAAQGYAQQLAVNYFEESEHLLNMVQAVTIAVPTSAHYEYGKLCAQRGKHIMMEKPLTSSIKEAEDLIEICRENGVILHVGHIERYNPAILELGTILENEEIISLDFRRLSPFDKRIFDTDVVNDLMIHDIDIMNSLINGSITKIAAQGSCIFSNNQADYAQAMVSFDNNVLVSLTASRVTEDKIRTLHINTKSASVNVDYLNRSIIISRRTNFKLETGYNIRYRQENITEKVYIPMTEPLKMELLDFSEAIATMNKPKVDGEAGLKALDIANKISYLIYN